MKFNARQIDRLILLAVYWVKPKLMVVQFYWIIPRTSGWLLKFSEAYLIYSNIRGKVPK
jgi:hypothetical protein